MQKGLEIPGHVGSFFFLLVINTLLLTHRIAKTGGLEASGLFLKEISGKVKLFV
jgi:hypothetical protein